MPETLKVAVCICQEVTFADFMMPMELLGSLNFADHPLFAKVFGDVPYRVKIDYLASTLDIVSGFTDGLPGIKPTRTYADAMEKGEKYDIIWVPAGRSKTPQEEIEFLKGAAPDAKYVMSVCAGSSILASAGLLDGKRATTNKFVYKFITNVLHGTNKNITWVPKARWVVDGNVWTSSGVTAGTDMALAFLDELVGPKITEQIAAISEIAKRSDAGDDPFAAVHGLI
ncbi:hypothetical protein M422DRAFT_186897 [Sphaerobolus stellatus SS14]|uniref:Unplaced genomic scaffold SPHSTscaffold_182, whole genome shotgun sequence n=1 Tax=Sphaerobolus stellatus (strain SS14) TaxID=990650 RepID=A0A0C9U882_SPHS4|nr:hypothetical protein M422DRAFT_186897 [Sphaerobolus stellatus SS14]